MALTHDQVMKAFYELRKNNPRVSCRMVSEHLASQGVLSPYNNQPYSRQRIRVAMSEKPQGRAEIERKKRAKPVIIENRPGALAWLHSHNLIDIEIISPNKVTLKDVKDRYVYGDVPLSMALFARSVWVITDKNGVPITADLPESEFDNADARLVEIKTTRIR